MNDRAIRALSFDAAQSTSHYARWYKGLVTLLIAGAAFSAAAADPTDSADTQPIGPVKLTQSQRGTPSDNAADDEDLRARRQVRERTDAFAVNKPGEFERFVSGIEGREMRRLGADVMTGDRSLLTDGPRQIPGDYIIGVGDELQVTLWGSIDANLRLSVDRAGRIVIPRVGPVLIAGVRYGDLSEVISQRVAQVFKNFQVSASLGKLRGIRVYVTGFTSHPGAYTVSSLATLVSALMQSGGPSSAGSFRQIELRRNGKTIAHFDLYDLLIKGDKSSDLPLQADDVVHIEPVGPQVAVLGSVNAPAIVELKGEESIADVLAMVGGFSAVADRTRLAVERLSERNDRRVVEVSLPAQAGERLDDGDMVRAFSSVTAQQPQYKQFKKVLVQGEVAHPGEYILPPGSGLLDAVRAAGGLTPQAYVFGTEFTRESVRIQQQQNYDRALRDLETEFTRNNATQKALTADEAAAQAARGISASKLIESLRAAKPTGRIVLQLTANARELPNLPVEDSDRLLIPTMPTTVGVFGSVFNGGSYLLLPSSSLEDMLKLAGGPTRGADTGSTFVLRANGSVVSTRQSSSGWLSLGGGINALPALPGDTIFVPEELDKTTFIQAATQWTQILYQFGLGAAALKTIKN